MSQVQRLAGPAGRQGPFVPVGGSNRNKSCADLLSRLETQTGTKGLPFVPVQTTARDKRGDRPLPPDIFLSPWLLSSHFSPSPLSLPYLLPPAPLPQRRSAPLLSSLPPARTGAGRGPASRRWALARAGARRAAGGAAMRRRWQLGFGRCSQASAGAARTGERREARPCAGGGSSAKPRRAARLGPGVGGAARTGEWRLSVAPASGAARRAPAAGSAAHKASLQIFFPNMYMDWDSYVLVNDFV